MASSDLFPHLRVKHEILPLFHRYGIPYSKEDNKAALLQKLEVFEVPLHKIQRIDGKNPPKLSNIKNKGPSQIALDFFSEGFGAAQTAIDFFSDGSGENSGEGEGEGEGDDSGDGDGPGDDSRDDPGDNSGDGPGDNSGDGPSDNSGDGPSDNSGDGPGDNSGDGPSDNSGDNSGDGPSNTPATTRTMRRLLDLPDHKDHAKKAGQAGIPNPANNLTDLERRLLLEYPVSSACLPTIKRGLREANVRKKVAGLADWFASVAKSQSISVGSALVFFDSYLSSPGLDFVAYLLDKDNYRGGWYGQVKSPDAKKQAAKRLDNLWSLALGSTDEAQTATGTTATPSDFYMDVIDPYDNLPAKGKVIGMHMTKAKTLGVRLPSLSNEYPDLGRGLWVDCKSGKEKDAYEKYVAEFPNKGKLSSASEGLLKGCETPADFKLDCVFRMKWGKTYHSYGYGHPKNGDLQHPLMFSKTALSKAMKGAAAATEMLETHREKTGQDRYEGEGEARPEVITLRAKRVVAVQ